MKNIFSFNKCYWDDNPNDNFKRINIYCVSLNASIRSLVVVAVFFFFFASTVQFLRA